MCVRACVFTEGTQPTRWRGGRGPAAREHPAQTPSRSQRQADSILGAQGATYRRRGHHGERAPEERGCGHTRRAPSPPRGVTAFPGSKATPHPRRPRISRSRALPLADTGEPEDEGGRTGSYRTQFPSMIVVFI